MARTHFILVPGFGGFDALGSIHYYAGITDIFRPYTEKHDVSLHYFDNLPTAAVETRAKALRLYLRTRTERGEFRGDDRLVLVGHSTGGLDIRRLVDLLDGKANDPAEPELLCRITHVVFLSTPQQGTNIADFVRANREVVHIPALLLGVSVRIEEAMGPFKKAAIEELRTLVRRVGHTLPPVVETKADELFASIRDGVHTWLRGHNTPAASPNILAAANDAVSEIDDRRSTDRWIAAQSRQIASDAELWLENIGDDMFAINDLASAPDPKHPDRLVDLAASEAAPPPAWTKIRTRSYATVGERPFEAGYLEHKPTVRSLGEVLGLLRRIDNAKPVSDRYRGTDASYALCYAACSAGPFRARAHAAEWLGEKPSWAPPGKYTPEVWDNDGIVNTASMFWTGGGDTRLVFGDHGDIIGHYDLIKRTDKKDEAPARENESYDLLGSSSGFDKPRLDLVWKDVFEFGLA